jgi:hypothetical protein
MAVFVSGRDSQRGGTELVEDEVRFKSGPCRRDRRTAQATWDGCGCALSPSTNNPAFPNRLGEEDRSSKRSEAELQDNRYCRIIFYERDQALLLLQVLPRHVYPTAL